MAVTISLNSTSLIPCEINVCNSMELAIYGITPPGTKILTTSPLPKGADVFNQSFLSALWLAYSRHINLELSPDDLWLTILINLNNYLGYHSEEMRSVFVAHEGKSQLIIETTGAFQDQDWNQLLQLFEQKIAENITPGLAEKLMPNFSTTTPHLRSIAQIMLMGITKSYFSYGVMTMCGIPSVTLKGTEEDWIALKEKISFLRTLAPSLDPWVTILEPIMDRFLETYRGSPDIKWWNSIIHHKNRSGKDDLSGWAMAFFPFHEGKWQLEPVDKILQTSQYGDVPQDRVWICNSVRVPVKYNEFGKFYDILLYAESRRVDLDTETLTVKPTFDYGILQLPDGTITDPYDWNDRSVKNVEARLIKKKEMSDLY